MDKPYVHLSHGDLIIDHPITAKVASIVLLRGVLMHCAVPLIILYNLMKVNLNSELLLNSSSRGLLFQCCNFHAPQEIIHTLWPLHANLVVTVEK